MFGIAVGHCRMSIGDFYAAELGEVLCVVHAFYNLQEQKERAEWERTRFLAYVGAKPHDSKKRIKKPSDLLPFPWENQKTDANEAKDFLAKAEAKAEANQKKWIEQLREKGLLNTIN